MATTTKALSICLLILTWIFASYSCRKCRSDEPRARIVNHGTHTASVQAIHYGDTLNAGTAAPGTISSYSSYDPGPVTFNILVNQASIEKTVDMDDCYEYDLVIDPANAVTIEARSRN